MDLLRSIRDIRHCDKVVKHIELHHNKNIDICFLNCASSVADNPGISQDKLSCLLLLNKSTIARNVAYLEEHGYLTREQCEKDRRIIRLYPTDKTHEVLPVVEECLSTWKEALLEGFSDSEKELYCKMTQKVLDNAMKYVKKIKGC